MFARPESATSDESATSAPRSARSARSAAGPPRSPAAGGPSPLTVYPSAIARDIITRAVESVGRRTSVHISLSSWALRILVESARSELARCDDR